MAPNPERDHLGKALDIAVRLSVVAIIVVGAFRIFSAFLMTVIWAAIIAITLFPLFGRLVRALGGRSKLAAMLFIGVGLALIIVPVVLLADSLLDATVRIIHQAEAGTLEIPPPTESVKTWPLVGERVHAAWLAAHLDIAGFAQKLQPQLGDLSRRIAAEVGGLAGAFAKTLIALVIAGMMMARAEGVARATEAIARRLGGADGPPTARLMVGTVRSVVKGVVLVALIQALAAAAGLVVAGVPGVGLWTLLVMMVAVMQLPPLLILGPIAVWVFAHNDSTVIAVVFLVWSLVVSASDSFLKAALLGRGVQVPMLVILVGAIGGLLRAGLIGLFVGPVVLTVFYKLFEAWVREDAAVVSGRDGA